MKVSSMALGVDVGGTNAKVAAISPGGQVFTHTSLPTQPERGPAAFVDDLCRLVDTWKKLHRFRVSAVGLGIAGDVDAEKGKLRYSPNLHGWEGFDFRRSLGRALRARVAVANDANCAVWGGYLTELKKKPDHVIGVTLGTGVGGGLILSRRLFHGATGTAGEIGHITVQPGGEPCHCGSRGCLEAYAGSYGILRTARTLLELRPAEGKILRGLCSDLELLQPSHLTAAAQEGDALAREAWAVTGRHLAVGLAGLVMVLNPDVLLLLGGVSRAGRWILDPVQEHFARQPFRVPFDRLELRLAENPDAGCIGAALLAAERGR
ncbi:MAG: ROK family protein [Elusimicrobia bacterium]|nr:ROK family protein [Elusimicrobiota bacterium]